MTAIINGNARELVELLTWSPGLQDSTDLEAATKTISVTSEPASADYTTTLTLAAPADARIVPLQLGVRLSVTIDSFGGGGLVLNYRIKRNGTSIGTGTLSTGGSTGNKLVVHAVTAGTLTGADSYTVFLWVDAGTCVISVCELWSAIGNAASQSTIASIAHAGEIQFTAGSSCAKIGTGTFYLEIHHTNSSAGSGNMILSTGAATNYPTEIGTAYGVGAHLISPGTLYLRLSGQTVATDLCYISALSVVLRSLV